MLCTNVVLREIANVNLLLLLIEYMWSLAPTLVLQVSTAYDSYVLNDEVASLPRWYCINSTANSPRANYLHQVERIYVCQTLK